MMVLYVATPSVIIRDATMMFAHYMIYAYGVLPLVYRTALFLYESRFKICPLIKCIRPLIQCVREPECKAVLDCLAECDDASSARRQQSLKDFQHVQFPADPALCRYQCFNEVSTQTAEDLIACIGGSGCVEPAKYSDQCAPIAQALSFDLVKDVFAGQWIKLYSSGWDTWPCQSTEFHAPLAQFPDPEPWMKAWPIESNVWRMNLNWTVGNESSQTALYTFRMSNEIYPGQQWDFASQPATTAHATLKTRAVMWGTEAHENWYLLDYDVQQKTMLVHYCAYTVDVKGFDAITMVLRRDGEEPFTSEMQKRMEQLAFDLLGERFGSIKRIKECNLR